MFWRNNNSSEENFYQTPQIKLLTSDIATLYRGQLVKDFDSDKKKIKAIINHIVTSAKNISPYHVKVNGISDLEAVILLIEYKKVIAYYNIEIGYWDNYNFLKDCGAISKSIQTYTESKYFNALQPEYKENLSIIVRYLGDRISFPITATRVYELNTYCLDMYLAYT